MAGTNIDLSSVFTVDQSSTPIHDGNYPSSTRPSGGFPAELVQYKVTSPPTERYSMIAVTPRPDSETGTFTVDLIAARYRWAFYDGVNPIRYEFALKVFGGSSYHIFELLAGPSGMTVGNDRTPANHGVIKWTPTESFPDTAPTTATVRVWGQDETFIDITWTIATTSSTDKFMFCDGDNGNDSTGDGSFASPFKTFAKFTGATTTTTTYPNRIVYLRSSASPYLSVAHTDGFQLAADTGPCRFEIDVTYNPTCYLAYPDEAVSIDWSGGEFYTGTSSDLCISGSSGAPLTILGSATDCAEPHNFWLSGAGNHRGVISWVTFDGFISGNAADFTNSAPMFSESLGNDPVNSQGRMYWGLHNVREINRTAQVANDALLHVFFSTDTWVEDFMYGERTGTNPSGSAWKHLNFNTSSRYGAYWCGTDATGSFSWLDQFGGGNNEIVWSAMQGMHYLNLQASQVNVGDHFTARCSVYSTDNNFNAAVRAQDSPGAVYQLENCALVGNGVAVSTNATVLSDGTECYSTIVSGDISVDPTNMQLVDDVTSFRSTYLGHRGWEVS